jgi:uncharacterized protein (TIGR03067 family)
MKTDLNKLQGAWNVVSLETDGQEMADASSMGAQIVVSGDKFSTVSMGAAYEGIVRVDAAQKPKTFDLVFTSGPEKGNTNLGIYELNGDTWKICLDTLGKGRPKKFATTAGSGLALETLTRATGDKSTGKRPASAAQAEIPLPDIPLESAPELEGEWAMLSCVQSGKALDAEYLKYGKRVAHDNETKITMAGQVIVQAKYTVDRKASPMTMDYFLSGGRKQLGIYRLDGETLTICFAGPGKERPANFASSAGDGRTFAVWKLVKR